LPAYRSALFWFRRDLRLEDNAGLDFALRSAGRVHCAFVFDREILDALRGRADRRVEFIHASVSELDTALRRHGGGVIALHDLAREAIPRLAERLRVDAVFANGDYEPAARDRDGAVGRALEARGRRFHLAKDQALLEKDEVLTKAGRPFTVFTPYRKAWMATLDDIHCEAHPVERHLGALAPPPAQARLPTLQSLGFEPTNLLSLGIVPGAAAARARLDEFALRIGDYDRARDFPALDGVSRLSVHNRFGTISIRSLARIARSRRGRGSATFLAELCWRDFFFQVLWHHPRVAREPFHARYSRIEWPDDPALLAAWQEGRTGYPLVDAAMRQLNATGDMHNRVRMVAASFLCKDLLVDWRKGERYFAERLNDFDLAANNGNWQWAASTGCDAQPWFRIFNPVAQSQRFDPGAVFIRRHVPELARVPEAYVHAPWTMDAAAQRASGCVIGRDYPAPVVDHAAQRAKALELYRRGEAGPAPTRPGPGPSA
jgi:deoxyribodipyrimidine photo-lyase